MAKKPGNLSAMRSRANKAKAAASAPATTTAGAPPAARKRTSPAQFASEVQAEARKITWTTRKETWITSVMVFIMVLIAAVFFFFADWILGFGVGQILKFANAG